MSNQLVEERLSKAYVNLVCNQPFFATVLLRLQRVEDPAAPTMWTDGKRLGYNPKFIESITQDELVGVLAHEVMHVVGLHPWRRQSREPKKWNIACDAVVNHIVTDSGFALPAGGVPGVADKSAEEIYNELPEMPGGGGGGGAWGDGGFGEVRDATNDQGQALSEAEREGAMAEAKVMIQAAINAAKAAGKLPAGLARYCEELLEPKVPWRELLAQFLANHAKNDFDWQRPNRRYFNSGLVLPSLHSPGFGRVMIGADTSGSIDQVQLKGICSEIMGCIEPYQERGEEVELEVVWFDHAAYPQVVSDVEDLCPQGGGGTSFAPVMEHVNLQAEPPKALFMITDGYCGDFGEQPACPVMWILTVKHPQFKPEFGEVIYCLDE